MVSELKKYVCKILCDGVDKGTGFLVTSNTIITASHVIEGNPKNISVNFLELGDTAIERTCKTIKDKCDYDVEILVLDKEIILEEYIPVDTSMVTIGAKWTSYGYPAETSPQMAPIGGTLTNVHDSFNPCDYNIDLDVETGRLTNYQGLSGSPLIINEKAYGILIYQNGLVLKAIEFRRVKEYLDSQNIDSIYLYKDDNICNIEMESFDIMENFEVKSKLNEIIYNQNNGVILLEGSVGIGKSTFIQHYYPLEEAIVLGKYFIKVAQDIMPISYRMSIDVFYEWLEEKISDFLRIRTESTHNLSFSKKVENISKLFSKLSKMLKTENNKALFFVDGIDEFMNDSKDELQKFLAIISTAKQDNIFFVVTTNNHYQIPTTFLQKIDLRQNIIEFKLYNLQQTKYYLINTITRQLSASQVEALSEKSMGHPLYLRYIINYVNLKEGEQLDKFINELPIYSGDIKVYYDFLWMKISQNSYQLNYVAFLARIRAVVDKDIFRCILPSEVKIHFESILQQLSYLFINKTIIFFHSSFADYIKNETEYMEKEIHHRISQYCLENRNDEFSIVNLLYHLSNGEETDLDKSLTECNQEWIDKCTALNVTPDLMIQDIKVILALACRKGDYISVIKILFLLERADFRYNHMFVNFAFEIAKAELSLNRPNKAMQCIIRKNTLILSIEDVLYCLEIFIQKKYSSQAKEILIKLESILMHYIESGEGIPNYVISGMLQAYQMYWELDNQYCRHKYTSLVKMLHENIPEGKEDEYQKSLNYIIASSTSYNLWKHNKYLKLEYLEKENLKLTQNTTELYTILLGKARELEDKYCIRYPNDFKSITKDIEKLIQILPLSDNYTTIEVLIEESENYELVKKLIIDCKNYQVYDDLREDNGVDISQGRFSSFFGYYRNQGYLLLIDPKDIEISNEAFVKEWEKGILNLIKYVATIYGRGLYCRANKDYTIIEADYKNLLALLENKLFNFDQRTKWKHSYHIPESILPILFKYITQYIVEFRSNELDSFLDYIKTRSSIQFGIYSEGYFDVFFNITHTLIKYKVGDLKLVQIVDLVFGEIKEKVQNRWERTPYLLNLVEIYNRVGCIEKAEETYSEMLRTSMGPTWYKEDQLSLLSEGFSPMLASNITTDLIRRNFILLDSASGGMTFERYIRVEKESLIGLLWNKGFYDIAFNFLKMQLYPTMEGLECNIKVEQIDASKYGLKSFRVANSIFMDSLVQNILGQDKLCDKSVKWVLSEIFMFGDERYLSDFIKIQSLILNDLYVINSSNLNMYIERVISILVCDCDEAKMYNFLKLYRKFLMQEIFKLVLSRISTILCLTKDEIVRNADKSILKYSNDIPNDTVEKEDSGKHEDEFYLKGTFGRTSFLEDSKKDILEGEVEYLKGNTEIAVKKYIVGLQKIHNGGWNIWTENSTSEVSQCLESIKKIYSKPEDIVKKLEPLITGENYCRYWSIANALYNTIESNCAESERTKIVSEIFNHLEIIVIPNEKYYDKYKSIEKWNLSRESEQVLFEFILWLAWYPDAFISQKAIDLLPWLINANEKYLINILDYCFSEDINISELSVTICLYLSDKGNSTLWKLINNYDILEKIIRNFNFIVKATFLQIYENYLKDFPEAQSFVETIECYFKVNSTSGDYNLGDDDEGIAILDLVRTKCVLDRLALHNIATKSIEGDVVHEIVQEIHPRKINDLYNLDYALSKSFRRNTMHLGYTDTLVYKKLNKVLTQYYGHEKSEVIANDIRRINPYFPNPKPESFSLYKKSSDITNLLSDKGDIDLLVNKCIFWRDDIVLYYCNYQLDNMRITNVNLESYIVPKSYTIERYGIEVQRIEKRYSNEYINENSNARENIICTVNSLNPTIVQGRTITPVFPNKKLKSIMKLEENDFSIDVWSSGREWEGLVIGMPKNEGCQIAVSKDKFQIPTDKKLVYKIEDEEQTVFIDMDNHMITRMG